MVAVKKYTGLDINIAEALRYAGAQGCDHGETLALLGECLSELSGARQGSVCYETLEVRWSSDKLYLGNIPIESEDMEKYLDGCEKAIIFAATIGVLPDRLIGKYVRISPVRALMTDACGSALVESLCDDFCEDMRQIHSAEGRATRTRVSPGYGDIPLGLQKDIFALLDCERKIGLSLTDSLLMTPTKSVTAIIGVT